MKIILDVAKEPCLKNDILIWNGKQWVAQSKANFLYETIENIGKLEKNFGELEEKIKNFTVGVNEKLENYHKILKNLTKGE